MTGGSLALIARRGDETLEYEVALDGSPVRVGIAWRSDIAEPAAVMLSHVVPGSPADDAGLRRLDRILEINGSRFTADGFRQQLRAAWGEVELLVEREGRLRTFPLSLPAI
jgi:predicted metalloprotease with PDZ domain